MAFLFGKTMLFPSKKTFKARVFLKKRRKFNKKRRYAWLFQKLFLLLHSQTRNKPFEHRGMEQLVARQAHNLEVVRSSRAPATNRANMEYNRSNAAVLLCVFSAI